MALYLTNDDVRQLLTTAECVDVLDDLFRQEGQGLVDLLPRQRRRFGNASSTLMGATAPGSQVVVTITNSREPVLQGEWLEPGMHVNAAGGNSWIRREIDENVVQRADVIAVDNLEQAKMECGDLLWPAERGLFRWQRANELHEVITGKVNGRPNPNSITLFESQGIGTEDTAASAYVYRKAREQGLGQQLPF